MIIKKHIPFYLLVFTVFLLLVSPFLLADGMFMDGLLYSAISNNLANGEGSFWKPFLTKTIYPEFYEHPPLAFGLQSLWFSAFGDSIWVEKFYSFFTFILVGIGIVKIWKHITHDQKYAWIPLLFWVLIPDNAWASSNNILENTMSVFVCFSVLFYLKSEEKKRFLFLLFSGLLLFLSFLTKGFTGLYVFGVPFFYWVFVKKNSFGKVIVNTVVIVAFTIIPLALLFVFSPDSYENISYYFTSQVLESVQKSVTVGNRFQIIIDFFSNILPALILGVILFFVGVYNKHETKLFLENKKIYSFFFAIALAGVLPIMISLKQRGFYIITVYPYFSLGFGLLFYPIIKKYVSSINTNKKAFKVEMIASVLAFVFSVFLVFASFNKSSRDSEMIKVSSLISNTVSPEKTISVCPEFRKEWSMHGYFIRNSNISLSTDKSVSHKYYLTNKKCKNTVDLSIYKEIDFDSDSYYLFEKK